MFRDAQNFGAVKTDRIGTVGGARGEYTLQMGVRVVSGMRF